MPKSQAGVVNIWDYSTEVSGDGWDATPVTAPSASPSAWKSYCSPHGSELAGTGIPAVACRLMYFTKAGRRPTDCGFPIRGLRPTADAGEHRGQRFIGYYWDENLPLEERLTKAGAPIAWPQLGAQAIRLNQ